METFLDGIESEAPALRALAAKHLADLKPERPSKEAVVSEGSGILWGWKEVSDYHLRISEQGRITVRSKILLNLGPYTRR